MSLLEPIGSEEDQKLHTTFYKICKFVEDGGFFVCTNGAFWAHQNTKISQEPEWVFVKTKEGIQLLKDSFLYKEFGIEMTGEVFTDRGVIIEKEPLEIEVYQKEEDKIHIGSLIESDTKIKRFRALKPESSNYLPLLREKGDRSFPLVAVQYGKGYLLHAGMRLTDIDSIEFEIIVKAIKEIVNKKLGIF